MNGNVNQIDFIDMHLWQMNGIARYAPSMPPFLVGAWKSKRHFPVHAATRLE